jgi:hypothetical protein
VGEDAIVLYLLSSSGSERRTSAAGRRATRGALFVLFLLALVFFGPESSAQNTQVGWMLARSMPIRTNHAMAYDAARQRVVLFGGVDQARRYLDDTWEWDGVSWQQVFPKTRPGPLIGHAMAYDAARGEIVMFGGWGPLATDETWVWNGVDWRKAAPIVAPPPRGEHAMAYDEARRVVVLFGGTDFLNSYNDITWEWDGSSWLPIPAPLGVGYGGPMAFDAVRRTVLRFTAGDTWEWDGVIWRALPNVVRPTLPNRAANLDVRLASDSIRGRVVLYIGSMDTRFESTWEWDGANWQMMPGTLPGLYAGALAFDAARGRTILYGGWASISPSRHHAWSWDGTAWSPADSTAHPGAHRFHAMAYDVARGRTVLFGASSNLGRGAETWEWDGARWHWIPTAVSPPANYNWMAYDAARRRVLLISGMLYTGSSQVQTWEWDGVSWRQIATPLAPPARSGAAVASDAARQRLVLFGGTAANSLRDTWEWDGAQWTLRTPLQSPPGGEGIAAYDAGRGITVWYGVGPQTWEWDGNNWSSQTSALWPSWRGAMGYDSTLRRVVHSGYMSTMEWDGTSWQFATGGIPAQLIGYSAMVFDERRKHIVHFGGEHIVGLRQTAANGEMYLYGLLMPSTVTRFGTGCGGPSGAPVLTSTLPFLGCPDVRLHLQAGLVAAPYLVAISTASQAQPLGGACTFYPSGTLVVASGVTNAFGFASVNFPVSFPRSLYGGAFFAQALVADPASSPLGLAHSPGLALVVGD